MKPTLRDVNSKPGLHTSEPYPKIHSGGSGEEEEDEGGGEEGGSGCPWGRPGHS